jgi:AGZA family xanthine/uracil permease-like MFS transporter
MAQPSRPMPLFSGGDLDGFFGLAVDNLIQFLLILGLCGGVLGFERALLLDSVLPGAAISMLVGNLYYARQARLLSAQSGRHDVTALPYGINTVSLFAYVFLVMAPVKAAALSAGASAAEASHTAWQIGLAACFLSGVIELAGAPLAGWVRRSTPRAALLSTLAGIAISFIAIDFAVRSFQMPLLALLPLAVILTTYFAELRLPLRIPGGAWAVGLGTAAAWLLAGLDAPSPVSATALRDATADVGLHLPVPVLGELWAGLSHPLMGQFFVPVIVPMGLFNVLGSLQNLESAEAAGDAYPTAPCMAVNGLGSLAAAVFGSCFPTTIYIGHPGWKALGARAGYSILNGVFFGLVALLGLSHLISALVPIEAGMAIVLWIGLVITAQAFQAVPAAHAPAVALGLFPAIAAWGVLVLTQTLGAAGMVTGQPELAAQVLSRSDAFARSGLQLEGLTALSQGFMLTSLIWAAASALLIDRRFAGAARWMLVGAALSYFGFVHAGSLGPAGGVYVIEAGAGGRWAIGYVLCAGFFGLVEVWARRSGQARGCV